MKCNVCDLDPHLLAAPPSAESWLPVSLGVLTDLEGDTGVGTKTSNSEDKTHVKSCKEKKQANRREDSQRGGVYSSSPPTELFYIFLT